MRIILFLLLTAAAFSSLRAAPPEPPPAPPSDVTLIKDVEYGKTNGISLLMHIVLPNPLPAQPAPVLIYIHGGGWHGGTRDAGLGSAYKFAEHGYVGATIEYRLSQVASFPAQLEDCKCAIRFLRAKASVYHIDPAKVGVMGDSAGGHLVALLGLTNGMKEFEGDGGWADQTSSVQAVCDCFGPTDILRWVHDEAKFAKDPNLPHFLDGTLAEHPEKARYASPMTYVASAQDIPPFLILHGNQDPNVPIDQSLRLAEALIKRNVDVTVHVINGVGHGGRPWGLKKPWPLVFEFFDHELRFDTLSI